MITVLTGENGFARTQALNKLVQAFAANYGEIAIERLDGESAGVERVRESLQSSPFLAARKLVILRQPSLNKQFTESVETTVAGMAETTDLIIIEPKIDKRSSYYKWLKQETDMQDFSELDEPSLARWLVTAAKEQGGELSPVSARLLVERVGANQQLLASELNKLLTYDQRVTPDSIARLTEPAPQSKIFDLLDAAFSGNARRALELYRDQRAQRVDPAQIIAMIAWQLRLVAVIKSAGNKKPADIVGQAKLSPYTLQKSETIAARLSTARLRQLITDLLAIDVRSKRAGRLDIDEALENYLVGLAQYAV